MPKRIASLLFVLSILLSGCARTYDVNVVNPDACDKTIILLYVSDSGEILFTDTYQQCYNNAKSYRVYVIKNGELQAINEDGSTLWRRHEEYP